MKFLNKVNRSFLILLTSVLLVSSVAGYFILRYIILDETKESLVEKENLLRKQIVETGEIPNLYPVMEVKELNRLTQRSPEFRMIMIQDDDEDELDPYLEYSNQIKIGDSFYSIKLRQSTFENEDLVIIIAFSLFIILAVAFGILFFISKQTNKTSWVDFEQNLKAIEEFNFSEAGKIELL